MSFHKKKIACYAFSFLFSFIHCFQAYSDLEKGSPTASQETMTTQQGPCELTEGIDKAILGTSILGTVAFLGITTYTLSQHISGKEIDLALNLILAGNGGAWLSSSALSIKKGPPNPMNYCIAAINAIAFCVHMSLAIDQLI